MILENVRSFLNFIPSCIPYSSKRQIDSRKINITPPPVKERGSDWEKRGHYYRRALAVTALPEKVEASWMAKITSKMPAEVVSCSQHIQPRGNSEVHESQLEYLSEVISHESEVRQRHLHEMFQSKSLADSTYEILNHSMSEEYVELSIYFEIRSTTKQDLESITRYVQDVSDEENFSIEPIKYRHVESLQANAPTAKDGIDFNIVVTAKTASYITLPEIWFPYSGDFEKSGQSKHIRSSSSDWP